MNAIFAACLKIFGDMEKYIEIEDKLLKRKKNEPIERIKRIMYNLFPENKSGEFPDFIFYNEEWYVHDRGAIYEQVDINWLRFIRDMKIAAKQHKQRDRDGKIR